MLLGGERTISLNMPEVLGHSSVCSNRCSTHSRSGDTAFGPPRFDSSRVLKTDQKKKIKIDLYLSYLFL